MKTKKFYKIAVLLLLLWGADIFSQANAWNYLNYECGGFALEIIPVAYPSGQQPASINDQVLYARTDVGGIYRSGNNGATWDYSACYFRFNSTTQQSELSPSEMCIQGMTVRHNGPGSNSPQTLVACWGNNEDDAKPNHQSIWRSSNNGNTWSWNQSSIESPGVWFKGNDNTYREKDRRRMYNIQPEFHRFH
jgi:hypothetical protein